MLTIKRVKILKLLIILLLLLITNIIETGKIIISKTPTKLPTKDTKVCKKLFKIIAKIVTIKKNTKFLIFVPLVFSL